MTVTADIDERIAKCRRILDQDPNSQIFAALAEAHRKKGELDKAFRICQNGLRIHPSYGSAHIVMAKVNLDRGMYDWAEVEVNKAIELEGNNRATELLLAEIHIYKGEFVKAIRLLKNLHQADPNNPQIKRLLDIAQRIPEEQKVMVQQQTPPAQEPTESDETPPAPEEPAEEAPLSSLEVLQQALLLDNLNGALFIDNEGLVVESEWSVAMDEATCGATLAEVCNFLTQELTRTEFGKTRALLIESGQHVLQVNRLDGGMFVFAADRSINLGNLRVKTAALVERYLKSQAGS
ncbi:tetratricopeptide repeat protein [candidate division GN15 bacterium]|nr:tetratricopeptide repeat protein [candidate division GN15 bacterium]